MRVTNNQIYGQSSRAIAKANERYSEIQNKISQQTNIVKPSDNPVGAGQVLQYQNSTNELNQYESNMNMAKGHLQYEEVALDSMNGLLDEARTLFIQAENTAYTQDDLDALTDQVKSIIGSMADLMNSKSADGSYIFAGTDIKNPAFTQRPDGRYEWSGNEGQKFAQISENRKIAVSDSGKKLFDDVWIRNSFNAKVEKGDVSLKAKVYNDGDYNDFLEKNYSAVSGKTNSFKLITLPLGANGDTQARDILARSAMITAEEKMAKTAPTDSGQTPDANGKTADAAKTSNTGAKTSAATQDPAAATSGTKTGSTQDANGAVTPKPDLPYYIANVQLDKLSNVGGRYILLDASGKEVSTGGYNPGEPLILNGMSFQVDGAPGATIDISLNPPKRDNVLNELNRAVKTLRDRHATTEQKDAALRDGQVSIVNTQESIGEGRSQLGARLNLISDRQDFSTANKMTNITAQDRIAGLDIGSAASQLSQADSAVTASQKLFTRVDNMSLFNKI